MLKTLLNELGNTTEQLVKLCALGAIKSTEKVCSGARKLLKCIYNQTRLDKEFCRTTRMQRKNIFVR